MRAPAPSLTPIIGAPTDSARSITLWIFSANTSPSAPPKTVKSCANTKTLRPSIVPQPVTTPSVSGRVFSIPKPWARWRASMSSSTKESGSRSRVEALPRGELAAGVLAFDRGGAPGVERALAENGELVEPLLDRVRHRCDRDPRALVTVQRLGLGLFLDLGLFDGHGPPNVSGDARARATRETRGERPAGPDPHDEATRAGARAARRVAP